MTSSPRPTLMRSISTGAGGSKRVSAAVISWIVCSETCCPSMTPLRFTPNRTMPPLPFKNAQRVCNPSFSSPVDFLNSRRGPSFSLMSRASSLAFLGTFKAQLRVDVFFFFAFFIKIFSLRLYQADLMDESEAIRNQNQRLIGRIYGL